MSSVAYFVAKFQDKSRAELEQIVENPNHYQADAITAAKQCLISLEGGEAIVEEVEKPSEVVPDVKPRHKLIVSRALRLVHYVIDFYIVQLLTLASMELFLGSNIVTGYFQIYYAPFLIAPIDLYNYWVVYVIYYLVMEYFGQITVGKLVTKTMVVNSLGHKLKFLDALKRSFARLIPFEAFSCLVNPSRGWHDKFSKSYVIERRNLSRFQELSKEQEVDEHLILD